MLARNVLGGPLLTCSRDPMTGWLRDGCCQHDPSDTGEHHVCIIASEAFLDFSQRAGNDLSTPHLGYGFAGLKPGDHWCLCTSRWLEALEAGFAPMVDLQATHEAVLEHVDLEVLLAFAVGYDS